jgi:hypothetical protein
MIVFVLFHWNFALWQIFHSKAHASADSQSHSHSPFALPPPTTREYDLVWNQHSLLSNRGIGRTGAAESLSDSQSSSSVGAVGLPHRFFALRRPAALSSAASSNDSDSASDISGSLGDGGCVHRMHAAVSGPTHAAHVVLATAFTRKF